MALFKNKAEGDPPAAGDLPSGDKPPDGDKPPEPKYVTMDQLEDFGKTLSKTLTDELSFRMTPQQQAQPAPAAAPQSRMDQAKPRLAQIDERLNQIDTEYADAQQNYDAARLSSLRREERKLLTERNDVEMSARLADSESRIVTMGAHTIDQLSTQVASGRMEYLSVPEVKRAYDELMNTMPPDQRMTLDLKMHCYNAAVGQNMSKIVGVEIEKKLRQDANGDATTQDPAQASASGREQSSRSTGPKKPSDVLSDTALASIAYKFGKGQGGIDRHYQTLGYKDWNDYYEKNKDYFEEEEEA
jgi:hypothetical protein